MTIDIINKKRLGMILSYQELEEIFNGFLEGSVYDYQMSSLLMAICIKGMTDKEIFDLTDIFIKSGDAFDFPGIEVDKHSTGGVGDKTTLIISPIVASLGIPVVKMSGRGLGITGGTIDKLESIPGFKVGLTDSEVAKQKRDIGLVITSQTANLVPLDKKVYALRDVTATVESIPLIASSIMSKKIAGGADKILIDIKVGKGALIKTEKDALKLKELMIKIGNHYKKEVRCVISNMNNPLGRNIGNALEVLEAIEVLKNREPSYLLDLCINLSSEMVSMAKNISKEEASILVEEVLNNGKAYDKFLEFVKYQHGNIDKLEISSKLVEIKSSISGVVREIDAYKMGHLALELGAGKEYEEDIINPQVGIVLNKLVGDKINIGDILCTAYVEKDIDLSYVQEYFTID